LHSLTPDRFFFGSGEDCFLEEPFIREVVEALLLEEDAAVIASALPVLAATEGET
jgi:hypothetical protein